MAFDAHKNLAVATVATAPVPPTSGTSLVVGAGEGARFPAAPFNATVWPAASAMTPANAEIIRCTARTGDTLTITRAQEGTTVRAIVATDLIAETITAKALTDIESGTNFPLITTPGPLTLLASPGSIQAPGALELATNSVPRQKIHASGGISFGTLTDPGTGSYLFSATQVSATYKGTTGNAAIALDCASASAQDIIYFFVAGTPVWFHWTTTGAGPSLQWANQGGAPVMTLTQAGNLDVLGTVSLRGPSGPVTLTAAHVTTLQTLTARLAQLEARLAALESQP